MTTNSNGSYAEAGVDIEAGDALVERIKPFAKATGRPGTTAALGGFGGLFDLKAAGFTDPILVASNDGVGTKVKIAAETGLHDTIGIDLVAMCVNDVVVQGARAAVLSRLFRQRQARHGRSRARDRRHRGRLPPGGCRADRRRNGGNAGHVCAGRLRSRGLLRGRGGAGQAAAARGHRGGRSADRRGVFRRAFERLFAGAQSRSRCGAFLERSGAVRAVAQPRCRR